MKTQDEINKAIEEAKADPYIREVMRLDEEAESSSESLGDSKLLL